jgi:hypothetical protein
MDNDDEYMKDPRAKTVEGFVAGLGILAKYMEKGMQESYFCGGEHDAIHIYVELEDLPEDSEDGLALVRLGFHASDADNWAYFT